MLINAVVIVLREVLEAGLMVSVLLALARNASLGYSWLLPSLIAGMAGALAYAWNIEPVSALFDYTGQEIANATLQVLIYLAISLTVIFIPERTITLLMATAVALAMIREGSEILIYLSGILHKPESTLPVITGSLMGLGIGTSVGILLYFGLNSLPRAMIFPSGKIVLALLAAGILCQAIPLLVQADLIQASAPLWDTTALLPEDSLLGQLLYAASGYEATPPPEQVITYLAGILFIAASIIFHQVTTSRTR